MTLPLYEYASISQEARKLKDLAALAIPEDWGGNDPPAKGIPANMKVLFNYVHFTFIWLQEKESGKIQEVGTKACFNTGLVTPNQEAIVAYFEAIKGSPTWSLECFCKESDNRLAGLRPLPEPADYISVAGAEEFVFDTRLQLVPDYDHIILENAERLPPEIRNQSPHFIGNVVRGAVDAALKRVRRNYKTAIPQCYRGEIQLLIPICISDPAVADFALAVKKEQGAAYVAKTCLTLDMAYNNARLIARPDVDWLRPKVQPAGN